MIKRSQIKFHETFQPEMSYISKILQLANDNYSGTKFEISEVTGIPTGKQKGKVEPHIRYAAYMGLIHYVLDDKNYTLSLTPLGNEIFTQDLYLHETLTHWLCHYSIASPKSEAYQWNYLISQAHPGYFQGCSNDYLLSGANREFQTNCSFEEMFGPIKRCYVDGFFTDLDFVDWDQEIVFKEQMENPEYVFFYALALLDLWEQLLPDRKEITFEELMDQLKFGNYLGFNIEDCNSVLDSLTDENIISVNRQLVPATIIKLQNTSDVVPLLFSRLL